LSAAARDGEEEAAAGEALAAGVMGGEWIICVVVFRLSSDEKVREFIRMRLREFIRIWVREFRDHTPERVRRDGMRDKTMVRCECWCLFNTLQ
jgi:hypothetical protein